ncbi:restriction endonuclease subunit S [Apilactobacillus timberlakei]|uniref:restriction endonuclease subunit S n=1 Tax=Apilactobacillus timberlakei TaxID=2008380 RepID=UPI00112A78EF|nr:restriction endonuclease subunit S [Apilactobacillus timberlakei]TPR18103.1 restriction endonuclease subunit S [Apilactobacillus timberlakei]
MTKNSTKKIPQLRFKGFEGEWEKKKFNSLVQILNGLTYSPNNIRKNGTFVIRSSNINNDRIINADNVYVDNEIVNSENIKKNDVIIVVRNGSRRLIGKHALVSKIMDNTVVGAFMSLLRSKNGIFINAMLSTSNFKKEIYKSLGATINQITKKDFSLMNFYVPSNEEQQKIGNFFAKLDQLIDLQTQKLEQLKKLKRGYLQKMFPQDGENIPQLRFKGFSGEWENNSLSNLGETFTGLSGKNKNDFGHGDAQYITYKNVYLNPILSKNMNEKIELDDKQNKVKKGDIFFTTSSETPREVGLSSVLTYNKPNLYLNSFTFGYRPNIKFNNYFISYLLRSNDIRKKIYPLAQGISRYNLSKKSFMKIYIEYPSLSEQNAIGNLFLNISKRLLNQNGKLKYLKELKKAYLQKMFC